MAEVYRSMVQRYFTKLYKLNARTKDREDHCLLFHSNGIVVVTLAASHPALDNHVCRVNFQVKKKLSRLENTLSGKKHRGAQQLTDNSALCLLECVGGSVYTVYSCIRAQLLEVNERLVERPALLSGTVQQGAYIAILLPKLHDSSLEKMKLVSEDEYEAVTHYRRQRHHVNTGDERDIIEDLLSVVTLLE